MMVDCATPLHATTLPHSQFSVLSFRVKTTKPKEATTTSTTPHSSSSKKVSDVAPHPPNIEWMKNPHWTWTLITYLTDHPDFRMKLFSNSREAKNTKTQQCAVLAEAIFSKEPTQADGFAANPQRYATSVETRLRK